MGVLALVGTRKRLFRLEGDDCRRAWQVEGPLLDTRGVYHAIFDVRTGVIHAAANHNTYGPTVQRSVNRGMTGSGRLSSGCPKVRVDGERGVAHRAGAGPAGRARHRLPGRRSLRFSSAPVTAARGGRRTPAFSSIRRAVGGHARTDYPTVSRRGRGRRLDEGTVAPGSPSS
jgi:hypothetical protein